MLSTDFVVKYVVKYVVKHVVKYTDADRVVGAESSGGVHGSPIVRYV
jgi:hypothetical protein